MTEQSQTHRVTWPRDLVPAEWITQPERSTLWVRVYRVIALDGAILPEHGFVVDLAGVRGFLAHTSVTYFPMHQLGIEFLGADNASIAPDLQERESPAGPHLMLMAPYGVDGGEGDEPALRQRMDEVAGLFAAFGGRNMVYAQLSETIVHLSALSRTTVMGSAVPVPSAFEWPDLSGDRLAMIETADGLISGAPAGVRRRALLSLRWLIDAVHDHGVGAFVKSWIAVETLATTQVSKVGPISESLGRAYAISTDEARAQFEINRVNRVRDSIVHRGNLLSISIPVLLYVQAVYVDILFERVGLPSEHRATTALAQSDIPKALDELLRSHKARNRRALGPAPN